MSNNKPISRFLADIAARGLREQMLANHCERVEIAGSIRRGVDPVGDIELVVLPGDLKLFKNWLAREVEYGEKIRWRLPKRFGDKYIALLLENKAVDVYICNPHNFGVNHWLRTGPADANQMLMEWMAKNKYPVRLHDGHLWVASYADKRTEYIRKLACNDESTFWAILGIDPIRPERRTFTRYTQALRNRRRVDYSAFYADEPRQPKLF